MDMKIKKEKDLKLMEALMKKVLVTGGTIFVSRYIAEYYVAKGYEVYVLNRNSREQSVRVKIVD